MISSIKKRLTSGYLNNENLLIIIILSIVSASAITYFYINNQILLYNDARGHLDIARRVIDGLTPGPMQIGSVWLPLYQLLEIPLIWSNFLWHSGLAGSFISGLSYVGACYFIYKIVEQLTKSKIASIIGLLIFALNPNLLYLQSVPLDEVLTIFMINASLFYILKWANSKSIPYLILSAFFVLLGSLARYETWFLLAFEALYVFIVTIQSEKSGHKLKRAEGFTVLFSTLAFCGLIFWFLYNFIGWNNPLYFLNSEFSAKSQQLVFMQKGFLLTKHNLLLSLTIFIESITENLGSVAASFFSLSIVYLLIKKDELRKKLFYLVTLVPIMFILAALFLGIIIIFTKSHPSPISNQLFNIRYGILGLIPAAIIIGSGFSEIIKRLKKPFAYLLLGVVVILSGYQLYSNHLAVVVDDGLKGISASGTDNEEEFSSIIGKDCSEGLTLISAGSNDGKMFATQLPMKSFISEGSGKYWKKAISNPQSIAKCVVMTKNESDSVYKKIYNNPKLLKNYINIYEQNGTVVYRIKTNQELENESKIAVISQTKKISCNYSVQGGDSLWRIARSKLGNGRDFDKIMELNKDKENNFDLPVIHPNQQLVIPCV